MYMQSVVQSAVVQVNGFASRVWFVSRNMTLFGVSCFDASNGARECPEWSQCPVGRPKMMWGFCPQSVVVLALGQASSKGSRSVRMPLSSFVLLELLDALVVL